MDFLCLFTFTTPRSDTPYPRVCCKAPKRNSKATNNCWKKSHQEIIVSEARKKNAVYLHCHRVICQTVCPANVKRN
ncbi:hypothetical protein QE152_g7253 [Popillia japonica]|uniref:Secreted protein n=1 Tax=Popillia japonica TaxID=7064 RepID=A0AAW1MFC9_POPJA